MNTFIKLSGSKLLPLSALTLALLSPGAFASVIDDFSVGQGAFCASSSGSALCVTDDPSAPGQLSSYVNGGMLSGERDIYIEALSGSNGTSNVHVRDGQFTWSNDTGAESKVVIQWDGEDGKGTGLAENKAHQGTQDFNDLMADGTTHDYTFGGTNNGLMFSVSDNEAGFGYELLFTDANGMTAILKNDSMEGEGMLPFNFSDFVIKGSEDNALASGFDFSQVDNFQITLTTDGNNSSIDFALNAISTIPEPTSIALFATALLGAGAASRRRNNQQKR